jgi:hypothetical protein
MIAQVVAGRKIRGLGVELHAIELECREFPGSDFRIFEGQVGMERRIFHFRFCGQGDGDMQ